MTLYYVYWSFSLHELVINQENGLVFHTDEQLSQQIQVRVKTLIALHQVGLKQSRPVTSHGQLITLHQVGLKQSWL